LASAAAEPAKVPPTYIQEEAIVPGSMCLTLLVRDGLGLPTVRANHQPASVKIALPRRLERLAQIDLVGLGLSPGVFLDSARLAPYSVASGALMPIHTGFSQAHMTSGTGTSEAEKTFLKELSELLSRLYAESMGSSAFLGQGLTVSPVINTFSGNLFVSSLDAVALWKGLNVMVYRHYNGLQRSPGPFGPGWTHNFASSLEFNEDATIQYTRWDGSRFCYKPDGKGGYNPPEGFNDVMTRTTTGYSLTDSNGFFLLFDSKGTLTELGNILPYRLKLEYKNGLLMSVRNIRVTPVALGGAGVVLKDGMETPVATMAGPGVFFAYDEQGRITQIRSTSGGIMEYRYDDNGRLGTVTSNTQQTVEYRYDSQARLAEVRNPTAGTGSPTILASIIYDSRDRVASVTDTSGNMLMRFNYRWAEDRTTQVELGQQKQLVTDRYDERGVLVERVKTEQNMDAQKDAAVGPNRQTRDCDGDLNTTILNRNDGTNSRWIYDRMGRMVRAQDSNGAWVDMTYDRDQNVVNYIRESGGRWIRLVYDSKREIQDITLDDGYHYRVGYDDGGVPRDLIDSSGNTVPLDIGLPSEVGRQLWEF
jgi:YD repeat-containing protein